MKVHYSTFRVVANASPLTVILAAVGNNQDGKPWPDLSRAPDLGSFQLPTDERARDLAITYMFSAYCHGTGAVVLIAFDDSGNAKAWRYTGK